MGKVEAKKIAKKYLRRLESRGVNIYKAFLFGSYSNGKATKNSDIDIGIFSQSFTNYSLESQTEARMERWDIDLRIEPHFFSNKDLDDNVSSLIYEITQNGEEIVL